MNYNMINYKNNQTVKFILPLITDLPARTILRDDFLGAFIGDVDRPEYDGKILLAYKVPLEREGLRFEISMRESENYYTSYDYDPERIVVYVFDMPEYTIDSIEKILDGKYSKISPELKLEITKFWFNVKQKKSEKTLVEKVLSDDSSDIIEYWNKKGEEPNLYCVKGEYWFIPDFKDELFYIKDFE